MCERESSFVKNNGWNARTMREMMSPFVMTVSSFCEKCGRRVRNGQ